MRKELLLLLALFSIFLAIGFVVIKVKPGTIKIVPSVPFSTLSSIQ